MLLARRVKRRILADREAQMELDAALDEPVDAAHHDLLLQLEARDAIGEEPARAVVAVIDMDLMPRGAQIFRSGQPRRTRADDADRLAGRGADVQRLDPAFGPGGVGDIFLDAADRHRAMARKFDHAIAFAQAILRAESAADTGNRRGSVTNTLGFAETAP